jgi:hypothetical protein
MPKIREDVTTNPDNDDETHPAFGLVQVSRITSNPAEVLFQSDIRHAHYIEFTVSEAVRRRDLKHDWVHGRKIITKFALSEAQFASLVASGGTEGVPVTLEYTSTGSCSGDRPGLKPNPRLQVTTDEVRASANAAFEQIKKAEAAYEAVLENKGGVKERRAALNALRAAINNATPNVEYAAKKLTEHAEEVVERSRADVEAMVIRMAEARGLTAEDVRQIIDGNNDALAIEEG